MHVKLTAALALVLAGCGAGQEEPAERTGETAVLAVPTADAPEPVQKVQTGKDAAADDVPDEAATKAMADEAFQPEPLDEAAGGNAGAVETADRQDAEPAEAAALTAIPARFQGVWDYEKGTCVPESDLRLEITARGIGFYESYGTVTAITAAGEDVRIDLAMEGEGDTWTDTLRLAVIGEGQAQRLHPVFAPSDARISDLPRKACPA